MSGRSTRTHCSRYRPFGHMSAQFGMCWEAMNCRWRMSSNYGPPSPNALLTPLTPERENHGVDLVWVWIDPRLTMGCRLALAVVGSADPHEVLGKHPEIEVVEGIDR